uniref:SFRICE_004209 n=1 Tax=Spodoptera frugiperda TaxID=7108 RepID=A0A2H1VGU4_SPOFR
MKTQHRDTVKYVFSSDGEEYVLLDGYSYQRLRTYSTRVTTWACSTHYKEGCKAKIQTSENKIILKKFKHYHKPMKNWTNENLREKVEEESQTFYIAIQEE